MDRPRRRLKSEVHLVKSSESDVSESEAKPRSFVQETSQVVELIQNILKKGDDVHKLEERLDTLYSSSCMHSLESITTNQHVRFLYTNNVMVKKFFLDSIEGLVALDDHFKHVSSSANFLLHIFNPNSVKL